MIARLLQFLGLASSEGRSSKWPAVEKAHIAREPVCQVCGTDQALEVHHVIPFSWPGGAALELADKNLITLCRPHHLLFGHLDDWKSVNHNVRPDCANWREKIHDRPYPRKLAG